MDADALFELINEFSKKGNVTIAEMELLQAHAKGLDLSEGELKVLISEAFNEELLKTEKIKRENEGENKQQEIKEANRKQNELEVKRINEKELQKKQEIEKNQKEKQIIKEEERKRIWKMYRVPALLISLLLIIGGIALTYKIYNDFQERDWIKEITQKTIEAERLEMQQAEEKAAKKRAARQKKDEELARQNEAKKTEPEIAVGEKTMAEISYPESTNKKYEPEIKAPPKARPDSQLVATIYLKYNEVTIWQPPNEMSRETHYWRYWAWGYVNAAATGSSLAPNSQGFTNFGHGDGYEFHCTDPKGARVEIYEIFNKN